MDILYLLPFALLCSYGYDAYIFERTNEVKKPFARLYALHPSDSWFQDFERFNRVLGG